MSDYSEEENLIVNKPAKVRHHSVNPTLKAERRMIQWRLLVFFEKLLEVDADLLYS